MEKLLKDAEKLPRISKVVAQEYISKAHRMAEAVSRRISGRYDLSKLIGDAPLDVMLDNHRSHGAFMGDVFLLGASTLLVNTLPWVYKTYIAHGFKYEYFTAEFDMWREVVSEFMEESGSDICLYYEWMSQHHGDFIENSKQHQPYVPKVAKGWNGFFEDYLEGLLAGDTASCMRIGKEAVNGGDPAPFFVYVVQPAMYMIGDMWSRGKVSVALEHLASAITARTLASLFVDGIYVPKIRGKVVVSASQNEFHEVGAWMVASCLEYDGWNVMYLGANTPPDALLSMIEAEQPDILALSMTTPFNFRGVYDLIGKVHDLEVEGLKIMVGGQAFLWDKSLATAVGADAFSHDCMEAVELARSWWRAGHE